MTILGPYDSMNNIAKIYEDEQSCIHPAESLENHAGQWGRAGCLAMVEYPQFSVGVSWGERRDECARPKLTGARRRRPARRGGKGQLPFFLGADQSRDRLGEGSLQHTHVRQYAGREHC